MTSLAETVRNYYPEDWAWRHWQRFSAITYAIISLTTLWRHRQRPSSITYAIIAQKRLCKASLADNFLYYLRNHFPDDFVWRHWQSLSSITYAIIALKTLYGVMGRDFPLLPTQFVPWRLCMFTVISLAEIFRNCLSNAVWQPAWGPVFCVPPRGANDQRMALYKSYLLLLLLELPWQGEGRERTYDSSWRLSEDESYFLRPRYRMPGERMGRVVVGRKMIIMTYRSISINYAIGYTEHGVLPLHHFFSAESTMTFVSGVISRAPSRLQRGRCVNNAGGNNTR